ncbi:HAMP domain-containing sensor histidine kinase [Clostridium ganghwense]|uniref:histidine kinase n=1 Tax=Clostridium ganghwense TaxID=312089 RepID=A0ABT4CPR1_9CLOT|nr:HAMP domain-containing sensor histidine kinase [Clostridium ganghwense]MCY6371045.1 ATP-binding protein [Clostridium ganghwense]
MTVKEKLLNFKRKILEIKFIKWSCDSINLLIDKMKKDIRIELILTCTICALAAFGVYSVSGRYMASREISIDYSYSINMMLHKAENAAAEINKNQNKIKNNESIKEILKQNDIDDRYNCMVVDLDGKVIYKSDNVDEVQIDIYTTMKNIMELKNKSFERHGDFDELGNKEYVCLYPIKVNNNKVYFIVKGVPEGEIEYNTVLKDEEFAAVVILGVLIFILLFLLITKRKVNYIQQINNGVKQMSNGNLHYTIAEKGKDELSQLAVNINYMAKELEYRLKKEREIEKVKNDLITNVSHDLRTPLTSIMGYLGLIKEKRYNDEKQLNEYTNIAFNKSEKLKILIDDLFEYTKAANKGMKLNKREIILNELLAQLVEEFVPVFEENELEIEKEFSEEKFSVQLDPDKIVRVFENLIMNAVKYSFKPGKVKISIYKKEDNIIVGIKNKSKNIPKEELQYLFERFYKVDKSRASESGGSGLGLAISKSIVEMHGGKIWTQCEGEDICFFVSFSDNV